MEGVLSQIHIVYRVKNYRMYQFIILVAEYDWNPRSYRTEDVFCNFSSF